MLFYGGRQFVDYFFATPYGLSRQGRSWGFESHRNVGHRGFGDGNWFGWSFHFPPHFVGYPLISTGLEDFIWIEKTDFRDTGDALEVVGWNLQR